MAAGRAVAATVSFGGGSEPGSAELLGAPVRWPRPEGLAAGLTTVKGVGPVFGELAAEAGVNDLFDLLWRLPGDYADPPPAATLESLEEGEPAAVEVEVIERRRTRPGRRGVVEARVSDPTGTAKAVWFNRPWVFDRMAPGDRLVIEGRLTGGSFVVTTHRDVGAPADPGPRPRHPAAGEIGPGRWARWTREALDRASLGGEPVPASTRHRLGLPATASALREAHRPDSIGRAEVAREGLAFEELFLHQVLIAARGRRERSRGGPATPLGGDLALEQAWFGSLPFELTEGQRSVVAAIEADLVRTEAMRRLLMGEVGSGKTVVAAFAIVRALGSGGQAALMAPTEVLAEQHFTTLGCLLNPVGIEPLLLTGSTGKADRSVIASRLEAGEPVVVVGTHALLGEQVEFERLVLAVVDEEHRFGVRQRTGLGQDGGQAAHRLHLSATPIPRTLALTAWGDLDLSELRELPAGRRPISTKLLDEGGREEAFAAVREEVASGGQAFVVCPLIEESDSVAARAAEVEADRLAGAELEGLELGLLHGRMSSETKEETMRRFLDREIDVLVATTVIEVGIDVPNAAVIVIEGAESFGLAQLHQLRGRVGRGERAGRCFLIAGRSGARSRERLSRLAGEPDGFRVAELDLELRGEGELGGTRQHGIPRFRVARLPADRDLLVAARGELDRLVAEQGGLEGSLLAPALAEAISRFGPTEPAP